MQHLGRTSSYNTGNDEYAHKATMNFTGTSGKKIADISLGHTRLCALFRDGSMKCAGIRNAALGGWDTPSHSDNRQMCDDGLNRCGYRGGAASSMGDALPYVLRVPTDGRVATAVSTSYATTCVLCDDGTVFCWGSLYMTQSNWRDDPRGIHNATIALGPLDRSLVAKSLSCGKAHCCAVVAPSGTTDAVGGVKCWGRNVEGQLGYGNTTALYPLSGVDLKTAGSTAYAMDGPNPQRECVDLANKDQTLGGATGLDCQPLPFVDLGDHTTRVQKVTCGDFHTCALTTDNTVRCWGKNDRGQLGYGDRASRGDGPDEMGYNLPDVDLYEGQWPPPPPPPPAPPPMADLGHIESHADWNCTVNSTATYCRHIDLRLQSTTNPDVQFKLLYDGRVDANVSEGTVPGFGTVTVGLDIVEARLETGHNLINVTIYTNEEDGKCEEPQSQLDNSTFVGYSCRHSTIPLQVNVTVSSGLVVFPQSHQVDVVLDESREMSSTVLFVDVENTAEYEVEVTSCLSFLSVPQGGSGTLARMLQETVRFKIDPGDNDLDFADGSPTTCTALVKRLDDPDKQEIVTFNVTGQRGAPSDMSDLGHANATAAGATTFVITPRDRQGNQCAGAWPGTAFTLKAVNSSGSVFELPGSSTRTIAGLHELVVPSLPLPEGSYQLLGFVTGPHTSGENGQQLQTNGTLTVDPISCLAGQSVSGDGLECVCSAGYAGQDGSCTPCPAGSYKEAAGDATSCTPCPNGATTSGTGKTSWEDCESPANTVRDSASNSFVCREGYYGTSPATTGCTACSLNFYKAGAGNVQACTPCPEGGTTVAQASVSAANCTCPANTELASTDGGVDKCECLAGYGGFGGACTACGLGTYKTSTGSGVCDSCPAGGTTVSTGSTNATQCFCPANSELSSDGSECVCSAGYAGQDGSCTPCPAGSYKEAAGDATSCTPCPNGATTSGTGKTSWEDCESPANTVRDSASNSFVCREGYYGTSPATTGCTACSLNFYKAGAGNVQACTPCPEGGTTVAQASVSAANCTCPANTELASTDGGVDKCECLAGYGGFGGACTACGLGTYKTSTGSGVCDSCPAGGTTVSTGSTNATQCFCPANSELSSDGSECLCSAGAYGGDGQCSPCEKGHYKSSIGDAVGCTPCPNGSTTDGAGSMSSDACKAPPHTAVDPETNNFVCQAGFFGSPSSAAGCQECPQGTFKDRKGDSIACTDCIGVVGDGGTTVGTGSAAASDCTCRVGFFKGGADKCSACPEGALCDGRGSDTLVLKAGYWRASGSSLMLHKCERPQGVDLCRGSTSTTEVSIEIDPDLDPEGYAAAVAKATAAPLCREGHQGFLCFDCLPGYGKRLGLCERCGGGGGDGANVVFVLLGALVVMVVVFLLVSKNLRSALRTRGEVALDGGRNGSKAGQEDGQGGAGIVEEDNLTVSVVKVIFTWLQLASLAASVRVPTSPEVRQMLEVESLGNVSPFSFSSFNCLARVDYFARFYATVLGVPSLCVAIAGAVLGMRMLLRRKRQRGVQLDTFLMIVQMLWFLTYTMVTEQVMSVFKCRDLDSQGLAVLSADVSVKCGTDEHRRAVTVGAVMLLLHTIGVPAQAALQMWWFRARLGETGMRVRWAFYFGNYRPGLFWYECFGMLRKAGLVAAVTLLQDRVGMQVFTISWVALIYLTVHTHYKPYEIGILNELETGALFVSAATLTSCVFFYTQEATDSGSGDPMLRRFERGVTWILILLSVGFLLWAVLLILWDLFGIRLRANPWADRLLRAWPLAVLTGQRFDPQHRGSVLQPVMFTRAEADFGPRRTVTVDNPLRQVSVA